MDKIRKIYGLLIDRFGYQGWWPVTPTCSLNNEKELPIPIYGVRSRTEKQIFEIIIGTILTQNTGWYPNVVLSITSLNLGRELTKEEKDEIRLLGKKKKDIICDGNINEDAAERIRESWKRARKDKKHIREENLIDPVKIKRIDIEKLARLIRSSGYFRQKSMRLKKIAEFFLSNKDRNKDHSREELLALKGIGPETADSILLYAYKKPEFVIDAYTKRIYSRLFGISKELAYEELKGIFESSLGKDVKVYREYHALLVELGKNYCRKIKPLCRKCPLNKECKTKTFK